MGKCWKKSAALDENETGVKGEALRYRISRGENKCDNEELWPLWHFFRGDKGWWGG